jgi:hypothetical protein
MAQENDSTVVKSRSDRLARLIDIHDLTNEGFNYWNDAFKGHWAGIEFGFSGFARADYSKYPANEHNFMKNDILRSNTLNLNLLQYSFGLQKTRNTIGLVTGIGAILQSYRLNSSTALATDQDRNVYPLTQNFESNRKSKLFSFYLDVPLFVEFQVPLHHYKNRLYFSAGVTGSKRLETHTKLKYRENGKCEKLKSPGDYSIPDYKISGTVRIGYRRVNLFASYDLVPFFQDLRGPVLYPCTIGLRLISF